MSTGTIIFGAIVGVAFMLMAIGTTVELTRCCDKHEYKNDEEIAEALYEASKFRQLEQYDKILLQRKTPAGQKLLAFSTIRNVLQLNIVQQAHKKALRNEQKSEHD